MYYILLTIYLCVAIVLVISVLLQKGKGADMGVSFGAGASATLFGSSGSDGPARKIIAGLGIIFFVICLVLGNISARKAMQKGLFDDVSAPVKQEQVEPEKPANATSDIPN